ncbi:MAG: response regulator transcription factor [Candidatus Promineofilum sp.]|nr:response regulator transcription factor [Promineifilum sp.]
MKVLVVEDDLALSDVVSFTLRRAGYEVMTAHDGLAAVEAFEQVPPDLILLDLNLPRLDGLGVCRKVRAVSDVPIIILSVRAGDEAVVRGLEMGADDYMVKPFSPTQLVARIRAVMRRVGVSAAPTMLTVAGLALDRSRGEVLRIEDGAAVRLTGLELKLLEALMLHPGQVLPSDSLITTVWGPEGGDRTMLKQLMYRLRSKIEVDASRPVYVETVPGIGYALNMPSD